MLMKPDQVISSQAFFNIAGSTRLVGALTQLGQG